jgi:hypothetical protein
MIIDFLIFVYIIGICIYIYNGTIVHIKPHQGKFFCTTIHTITFKHVKMSLIWPILFMLWFIKKMKRV